MPPWLAGAHPLALVLGGAGAALLLALLLRRPAPREDVSRTLAEIGRGQDRLVGALTQVAEAQAFAQSRGLHVMDRRLDEVTARLNEALGTSSSRTARSLGALETRLQAIDAAQERIERLSGDVLGLQDILSNKQARGLFGEVQLEEIVRQALPADAYRLQATLSNGRRADCLVRLSGPPGNLVIDAKFPLEAYQQLAAAETEAARAAARRALGRAVDGHLTAIAERYLADGETADQALMFVPAEAVFAEIHAHHGAIVRRGFSRGVWIVSPGTLMAVLTALRGVLRDARIREESTRIRRELALLAADVGRLGERVGNLDRHLALAQGDLEQIRLSAERTRRRAARLEAVEFDDPPASAAE